MFSSHFSLEVMAFLFLLKFFVFSGYQLFIINMANIAPSLCLSVMFIVLFGLSFCSQSTVFWLHLNLGHILIICHQKDQFGRVQFTGKSDSISKQRKNFIVKSAKRNFLVVQWLRLCAPKTKGPGFDPWSGNWIPHAATKSVNAANRDPTCRNEDRRSHMLQWRSKVPHAAMKIEGPTSCD